MSNAKNAALVCLAAVAALVLVACGGDEPTAEQDPAAQPIPPERVDQLDRRVHGIEAELKRLRKELDSREREQSDAQGDGAPAGSDDSGAGSGAGTGAGAGTGSGTGSGSGSDGGSGAGADAGAGPDPGSAEDDRSVYDICGPNPAPNC